LLDKNHGLNQWFKSINPGRYGEHNCKFSYQTNECEKRYCCYETTL